MAPQRKAVVKPEEIRKNWHLRPSRGHTGRGRVSRSSKSPEERREASRPWEPGLREYPPLAVIYEARPAYSVDDPPERPTL